MCVIALVCVPVARLRAAYVHVATYVHAHVVCVCECVYILPS